MNAIERKMSREEFKDGQRLLAAAVRGRIAQSVHTPLVSAER